MNKDFGAGIRLKPRGQFSQCKWGGEGNDCRLSEGKGP